MTGATETVAIFGGSFNPPHIAHVLGVAAVRALHDVPRVLVVPTYQHPFSKELAPYEDRVRMCELAMAGLDGAEVSRVEAELGGESRTLRTVQHLAATHPEWSLRLVLGADLLLEAPKWYRFDDIVALAPPIVLGRVGVELPDGPRNVLPEVSSTEVRGLVRAARWDELRELVPRAVLAHVRANRLYARP